MAGRKAARKTPAPDDATLRSIFERLLAQPKALAQPLDWTDDEGTLRATHRLLRVSRATGPRYSCMQLRYLVFWRQLPVPEDIRASRPRQ